MNGNKFRALHSLANFAPHARERAKRGRVSRPILSGPLILHPSICNILKMIMEGKEKEYIYMLYNRQ